MNEKKTSQEDNPDRPTGRDRVVAAVIEAAADLFSTHGFSGVSIREIAKTAGVNHGLIHRHFGSKENLRKLTLQHMADAMLADVKEAASFSELSGRAFQSLEKHGRFWRILARTILDGQGTPDIHERYPVARYMIERVRDASAGGELGKNIDPRLIVASMFAFACGFTLFEPFILAAVGLDDMTSENARNAVFDAAMALISRS
jgi:AcrR family transcriptional regulator